MLRRKDQIVSGKYYLTICGDVVGPAVRNPDPYPPQRCWLVSGAAYYGNGTAFGDQDGWALELVRSVPDDIAEGIIPKREHNLEIRRLERRIEALETALSALKALPRALKALETL